MSLFAKILLWFWGALVVIVATLVLLESGVRERGMPLPSRRDDPLAMYADAADVVFKNDGRAGVARMLDRLARDSDHRAYGLDSAGVEITGREVPPRVRAAAGAVFRMSQGWLQPRPNEFVMAFPLPRDGAPRLALIFEPPPRPPNEIFFLPQDLGLLALAMILVSGIGCYFLARHIAAPVKRLGQATRRLAAGDLSARVGVRKTSRHDELAALGHDFDRMAERMENLLSVQRRLLSDISHELRSPLARMNVALGLLRQRGVADDEGMLERLETESARLNEMIGDLLTLSRLESGAGSAGRRRVDVGDLVASVVEDARFEARTRGCDVRCASRLAVTVEGVPELLHSAFENVVRNAVRHTADGTAVEIAMEERRAGEGTEVVVEILDHGPGVPESELERIFEPFHRVDHARERASGGAGLGLAIARRAVVHHGGTIEAHPGPGGGLLITIRLPVR